ncbi:flippase-like domain-containing protein [Candidatus Saccharibacteria bacterium]|nr:flippase-like domain-containing protein [Candidatus Saccharibacteria bacterium]
MSKKTKARWKIILNLVMFIGFVGLVFALRGQIADSIQQIDKIQWQVLLLLPIWQALNYHAYAKQNQALFAILGNHIKYKFLYRVNLELNFVNHVLPSGGVSGFSYFSLRMKDRGVPSAKSSLVQILRFALVFITFQVFLFLALIALSFSGQVNSLVLLVGGSISTLILVGTLIAGFIIGSSRRINLFFGFITKALNKIIHLVRPKHPETIDVEMAKQAFEDLHKNYVIVKSNWMALKMPIFWSFVANITEILTLYSVYVAFGHWVNPGAVILALAVANFAGFLSVLPSGIGVYETLMTGMLAVGGIPASVSIPVTVMYRVISITIQIIPGYYLYYTRDKMIDA